MGTYSEEYDHENDHEYEQQASHPPRRFPLIIIRRHQFLRCSSRIVRDRNHIRLDVVYAITSVAHVERGGVTH